MKNAINNLLRNLTGYQLTKADGAPYVFRDRLKEFLDNAVPATGKILDIGAGPWKHAQERFGKERVTTLDTNPPADIIGSVLSLPFPDKSFGTVICLETLEHVEDPFKAMAEMRRVLSPGGTFIGSTPFMHELHGEEYGDYWRFTRQGWMKLLEELEELSITPYAGRERAPGWYLVTARKPLRP